MKKCRVILNNDFVTVFNYDGSEIQIPAIKRNAPFVNVIEKDGRYIIVDDDYCEVNPTTTFNKKPKRANKKTTDSKRENIKIIQDNSIDN